MLPERSDEVPLLTPAERRWLGILGGALLTGVVWGFMFWGLTTLWPHVYDSVPLAVGVTATVAYIKGRWEENRR